MPPIKYISLLHAISFSTAKRPQDATKSELHSCHKQSLTTSRHGEIAEKAQAFEAIQSVRNSDFSSNKNYNKHI
jgi:hypothetical protein